MIKNIKTFFNITAAVVIGSLMLWSCESDADQLGSQFFQDGATGIDSSYAVIAYNMYNHDSIRTDAARLQTATLGAFSDPQFGMQKSDYVTQVRLYGYNSDFGANPVMDSVVLSIKPEYVTDSATTTTKEDYIYPEGNVPAKLELKTYPVKKYGKAKIAGVSTTFNIKVEEVSEFLGSNKAKIMSDKNVATSTLLGTKVFDGTVNSMKITKDTDNTVLAEKDASLRIKLDTTFFKNKILTKGLAPELSDAASFIRYFKGIKISVEENDGYIFKFNPNDVVLNIYYKKDKVENNVTTKENATIMLDLAASNTHFNQIKIEQGTPAQIAASTANILTGDQKIYAQGMGGPGIGIRVKNEDVEAIRDMYKNEHIGITSAKIRLYTDVTTWNNSYAKPDAFVVRQRDLTPEPGKPEFLNDFLIDMSALAYTNYLLVKSYDLDKNPAYYDISITQTFKNIIEKLEKNNDLIINVGAYTMDSGGSYLGAINSNLGAQNFNTRSYTPNRAVFVGTDPANAKSAKLILTYGKK